MTTRMMGQALRQRGLKLTQARQAVLQVLGTAAGHLRVSEVHQRARRIAPAIGLASVYRAMELLARLHLIRPVHIEHRHRHYACVEAVHGHHLVCTGCSRVIEFSDCRVDRLAGGLAKRTGFRIDDHSIELYGRCPTCQGRQTASPIRAGRPSVQAHAPTRGRTARRKR